MGEGYRIVAASRGLKTDEKQEITRNSPSHESLCGNDDAAVQPWAAAFYPLPTKRLCVAYSCLAGTEHTGRGGQRVYTHNVIFSAGDFARFSYNPFEVVRAMLQSGAAAPQLKPAAVLSELVLNLPDGGGEALCLTTPKTLAAEFRRFVLQRILHGEPVILDMDAAWMETAEIVLLGIPSSDRCKVSFSAGLRFATARRHRLQLLHDPKGIARARTAAQPVAFLDPTKDPVPSTPDTSWNRFVERHWARGDFSGLARRTNRPFPPLSPQDRERVAGLFNTIDSLAALSSYEVLCIVADAPRTKLDDYEDQLRGELVVEARKVLSQRVTRMRWSEAELFWRPAQELWRRSPADGEFAWPLLEAVLRIACFEDPVAAAETALDLTRDLPAWGRNERIVPILTEVLHRFAERASGVMQLHADRIAKLCDAWQRVRPDHPDVRRAVESCAACAASRTHPS